MDQMFNYESFLYSKLEDLFLSKFFLFFFFTLCKTVFYIVIHPLLHKALQHMKSLQGDLLALLLLSHLISSWKTLLDIWWHILCLIKRADFKKSSIFRLWRCQSYIGIETRWCWRSFPNHSMILWYCGLLCVIWVYTTQAHNFLVK